MEKKMYTHNQKGFTLIETLVSLTIFTFAVVALVTTTAGGLNNVNYAKNKVIATTLAGEGIELIRNIRDTSVLTSPTGWTDFTNVIDNGGCTAIGCYIEPRTLAVSACSSGCPFLDLIKSADTFYYGYSLSGTESVFSRTITIENVGPDEMQVTSKVEWLQGSGVKEVVVREHLFNWFVQPTTTP